MALTDFRRRALASGFRPGTLRGSLGEIRAAALAPERRAVVEAIQSSPNITEAARKLGASRRTLQNRMRQFGLPPGKSGRPHESLPYKSLIGGWTAGEVAFAAGLGIGAFFVGRWWGKKMKSAHQVGLDMLAAG